MAAGRIMAREVLQRAANFFRVEGIKQAPAHLNLEQVLLTYALNESAQATPGAGEGLQYYRQQSEIVVGGAPEFIATIIDDGTIGLEGGPLVSWRVDHLDFEILFDAAGRTAMNDKGMYLRVEIYDTQGDPGPRMIPVNLQLWWYGLFGGQLRQVWTLYGACNGLPLNAFQAIPGSTWHGRVPAIGADAPSLGVSGFWGLRIIVGTLDGANIPANTEVTWASSLRKSLNIYPPNPS